MSENEEKNEQSEPQQSHRKKSIEEQADEIGDVKLSPIVVISIGIVICIGLIVALVKFVPDMLNKEPKTFVSKKNTDKEKGSTTANQKDNNDAPKGNYKIVKAPQNPKIKIKTNKGDMIVELWEDKAPNSVANFVELCQNKFYDDIRFHRIMKGFMIQGGCPFARGKVSPRAGTGDAGYKFADEIWAGQHFNERGLLAYANSGPNTNGSQFFIMDGEASWLDTKHTIFGKVVEGMDIVDKIANTPVRKDPRNPQAAPPLEDVYIISTEILQLRDHEYKVKKLH